MRVTVSYFGQLGAAGVAGETIELAAGAGIAACAAACASRHGEAFSRIVLDDTRKLRPSLLVTVNGAMADKSADTPLREGDTVGFLAAIAGG